jgi:hypothetical protein
MIAYSTSTPAIARTEYHFNYASKREAYADACTACMALNKAAKDAPDNYRHTIYKLKNRWVEKLYKSGFCVQVEMGERQVWQLVFLVDDLKYQWHMPDNVASWRIKENRTPVFYEWRDEMPTWHRSLEEAIALLEWVMA